MKNKKSKWVSKLWIVCLVVFCISLLSGCKGAPGMTVKDVDRRHYHSIYSNWLMFQDDLDSIFLIDRPSRLTPMYSR